MSTRNVTLYKFNAKNLVFNAKEVLKYSSNIIQLLLIAN